MRRALAALVLSAAWAASAQAAVLQLAPIPVEVEAPQSAAVLSLSNRATREVALQARVFRWSQERGQDTLAPTTDVAVSPPIVSVPAGQTLTLRIVRVATAPPAAEETYRIWIDELPTEKGKARKGQSLRILMRYSVPVFFEPAGADPVEPRLSWRLVKTADGARLTAENGGGRRVHVFGLQVRDAAGKAAMFAAGAEQSGYVLAGGAMVWTLKPPKDFPVTLGADYRLDYDTEAGSHHDESVSLVR